MASAGPSPSRRSTGIGSHVLGPRSGRCPISDARCLPSLGVARRRGVRPVLAHCGFWDGTTTHGLFAGRHVMRLSLCDPFLGRRAQALPCLSWHQSRLLPRRWRRHGRPGGIHRTYSGRDMEPVEPGTTDRQVFYRVPKLGLPNWGSKAGTAHQLPAAIAQILSGERATHMPSAVIRRLLFSAQQSLWSCRRRLHRFETAGNSSRTSAPERAKSQELLPVHHQDPHAVRALHSP